MGHVEEIRLEKENITLPRAVTLTAAPFNSPATHAGGLGYNMVDYSTAPPPPPNPSRTCSEYANEMPQPLRHVEISSLPMPQFSLPRSIHHLSFLSFVFSPI